MKIYNIRSDAEVRSLIKGSIECVMCAKGNPQLLQRSALWDQSYTLSIVWVAQSLQVISSFKDKRWIHWQYYSLVYSILDGFKIE